MSGRRIIRIVQFAIVAVSLLGGGAAWAAVSLGASFGYTHLSYPGIPAAGNHVLGFPGSEQWGQPGIRIGYLAPGGRWGVNYDLGFVHVTRSGTVGANETMAEAFPQMQANLRERGGVEPFVNGGAGIVYESVLTEYGGTYAATRVVFGGGIGVRRSVSEGHGLVRLELRYDHLPAKVVEQVPSARFTFPTTDRLSVKLGFDLIVGR